MQNSSIKIQNALYQTLGILTMLSSYFLYVTLSHTSDISNFIAVGLVGFVLMVFGVCFIAREIAKVICQDIHHPRVRGAGDDSDC